MTIYDYLTQEDNSYLLQETLDKILLEQQTSTSTSTTSTSSSTTTTTSTSTSTSTTMTTTSTTVPYLKFRVEEGRVLQLDVKIVK